MSAPPVGLVMHPDSALHDTGWNHPEHQGRLPGIVRALEAATPDLLERVLQREGSHAPLEAIERVHTAEYLHFLHAAAGRARGAGTPLRIEADTVVSGASWDAALASVGSALEAAAMVMRGEARTAFALCRPPGHHALPGAAMGFCLLNNLAITARALQADWGLQRILIVDWDVHHGNGTQDVFYTDPTVYYLSLHQSPWYPGTGASADCGAAEGAGTTRNVELPAGTTAVAYRSAFLRALDAALAAFTPDFILVSAGFDCLRGDPLGQLLLEPEDLHRLTLDLVERAAAIPPCRIAFALEGGYAPSLAGAGVVQVFRALAGLPARD